MDANYIVEMTRLRYIVPFKYNLSFTEACDMIDSKELWKRRTVKDKHVESDIYDYVEKEELFSNESDPLEENKIGGAWYLNAGKNKYIKELLYFPTIVSGKDTELPPYTNVGIVQEGLYIFRNKIGILWYEIDIPKENLDSNKLVLFQNQVKELNRKCTHLWEISNKQPEYGIKINDKEKGTYISPFLTGEWIRSEIESLNVDFFAKRNSAYVGMIKKSIENTKSLKYEKFGENILNLEEIKEKYNDIVPDKALLFSYVNLENDEGKDSQYNRSKLSFYITNGYKDSYDFREEVSNKMRRPFNNVIWYATKEGVSYIAWPDKNNKYTFENIISKKFCYDYFILYIKAVFQSYSLLMYTEIIQKEVSAVSKNYHDEKYFNFITDTLRNINIFLTKSMATSVSHIHHQSEFYVYLKERLRIMEDVQSITGGLQALYGLQQDQVRILNRKRIENEWKKEQKRDHEIKELKEIERKREKHRDDLLQRAMGLLAILGIASALVDSFDFIAKFTLGGEWTGLGIEFKIIEIICIIIISIIGLIALYFTFRNDKRDR